jgi:uncharacterized protein (DUF2062 family)
MDAIWQPLLLGCFFVGSVAALTGSLTVRALWRLKVKQSWQQRKQKRLLKKQTDNS